MNSLDLHPAQVSVLRSLRHAEAARYSSLLRPLAMDSDVFKFHVRKLVKSGLVHKSETGDYYLTAVGKEFANNLDKVKRTVQKQPKYSLMLVVTKSAPDGETLYLFQQRRRQPYWGYWGFLSGPLRWGMNAEDTAKAELKKQTGIEADFETAAFFRQRDYNAETHELLEDKLFQVMKASRSQGDLLNTYEHGYCEWLSIEELSSKDKYFEPTKTIIEMLDKRKAYATYDVIRRPDEY